MQHSRALTTWVVAGIFFWASVCPAQQAGVGLSPAAEKVRDRIRALAPGREVTLLMKGHPEYHGDLRDAAEASFTIYEVDEKRVVSIAYDDVKKVRMGYGRKSITGRRVDPVRSRIAMVALLAGLVAIVVAVAVTKD